MEYWRVRLANKIARFKTPNRAKRDRRAGRARKRGEETNSFFEPDLKAKNKWGLEAFLEKFTLTTTCYLTGTPIDLKEPSSYHLDHIVPTSRGGTNDLDNVGVTIPAANAAKGDLSVEELIELCKAILKYQN